jgi:dTDP-glucose pyrophosphorylase/predicted transcriptional regulator
MIERKKIEHVLINKSSKIKELAHCLNESGLKIALVVDDDGKLFGTITDGDLRRGLLKGLGLEDEVSHIANMNPITSDGSETRQEIILVMERKKIQHVPVVDKKLNILGMHIWNEINYQQKRENPFVIMAGGRGQRMMPHTQVCPKPMLLIGNRPMLQIIIERAKAEGFYRFIVSTNYLGQIIKDYFKDGSGMGVSIEYINEDIPLGTAGALSLIEPKPELTLVVTNGDVITDVKYGELLDFHKELAADITMAVCTHEWQNPYGVVEIEGSSIIKINEKPITRSFVNAGIYVMEPALLNFLDRNERCDMTTLVNRLKEVGSKVVAYPVHEQWFDVGIPDDLLKVNQKNKT